MGRGERNGGGRGEEEEEEEEGGGHVAGGGRAGRGSSLREWGGTGGDSGDARSAELRGLPPLRSGLLRARHLSCWGTRRLEEDCLPPPLSEVLVLQMYLHAEVQGPVCPADNGVGKPGRANLWFPLWEKRYAGV